MTKLKVILFILIFAFGCDYSGSQNNTKTKSISIEQLITQNKYRFLFLSFWDNMNEQEFNQILKYENNNGNLNNGKFLLMISSTNNIPLEVSSNEHSVTLTYTDKQWINYLGNSFYEVNEIPNGKSYYYIENFIEKLFDEKYQRISLLPKEEKKIEKKGQDGTSILELIEQEFENTHGKEHKISIEWKSTNENPTKLITLYSSYNFFDKNYNKNSSSSGATSRYYHDKENSKVQIGECFIEITYEFFDEHLKREQEFKTKATEWEKKKEQERKEVNNQIRKNNSNL